MINHFCICVSLCARDDELTGMCYWSHGYDEPWFYLCEIVVRDDELSGVCHWSHGYDELWFYLCEIVYKE